MGVCRFGLGLISSVSLFYRRWGSSYLVMLDIVAGEVIADTHVVLAHVNGPEVLNKEGDGEVSNRTLPFKLYEK